ncbi:uncharacterized protein LOC135073349 [Ostrinia nubilalis]|uniref:uncharacterized protein LOC135073349 n=1 Tax=Ostrinia nubilalis TaxID=29057 RepID=UPI00308237AA
MAVIRNPTDLDNPVSYVATVAFFCGVSCVVLMLKFRGFRASMNLSSWRKKDNEIDTSVSLTGAYRINRDDFYGNAGISEPPKKLTPSMVVLPPSTKPEPSLRPTKSTSDLVKQNNLPAHLTKSSHDVSLDPRGRPASHHQENAAPMRPERKVKNKSQDKEQKKLEKQRLAEQKSREKAEAQEKARKDKIRREAEKKAAQEQAKVMKAAKKKAPAVPQPQVSQAPPVPHVVSNRLAANAAPSYSTNTLESSISRTSGPPPYAETVNSDSPNTTAGNSNPGNVTFSKPIERETNSWDLISQHRQQMSRPAASGVQKASRKNMVLDLQYKLGNDNNRDNSDA